MITVKTSQQPSTKPSSRYSSEAQLKIKLHVYAAELSNLAQLRQDLLCRKGAPISSLQPAVITLAVSLESEHMDAICCLLTPHNTRRKKNGASTEC